MPERIQLSRKRGFRLPSGAISVARPSRWGNPFCIGAGLDFPFDEVFGPKVRDRAHAVEIFRTHARITSGYAFLVRRELAGKSLACWCPLPAEGEPDICHAAVLLELANGPACRHCGDVIIPCGSDHDIPVCKGWKHAAWLSMPIGAHYCEGRSINPSAEPAIEAGGSGA